jgi:hypothetical protein
MAIEMRGLVYDWAIQKIELNTAPYIKAEAGYTMRDPGKPGWREIEQTNARYHGRAAEYLLRCELMNNPSRR